MASLPAKHSVRLSSHLTLYGTLITYTIRLNNADLTDLSGSAIYFETGPSFTVLITDSHADDLNQSDIQVKVFFLQSDLFQTSKSERNLDSVNAASFTKRTLSRGMRKLLSLNSCC